ncbi:hypothetical protein D3C86_1817400 [compost metagenome]
MQYQLCPSRFDCGESHRNVISGSDAGDSFQTFEDESFLYFPEKRYSNGVAILPQWLQTLSFGQIGFDLRRQKCLHNAERPSQFFRRVVFQRFPEARTERQNLPTIQQREKRNQQLRFRFPNEGI